MRKPRPLSSEEKTFRDDRLVLIACDDTYGPKQYFNLFELKRVKVHVRATTDGTSAAQYVLERLLEIEHEPDDERWLVLDTDHMTQGTHLANLTVTLQKARQAKIKIAMSNPCFELWLLLHHLEIPNESPMTTAADVLAALKQEIRSFNKCSLTREHFAPEQVAIAFRRASIMDSSTGDIPTILSSRIYLIWESVLLLASIYDLPPGLRNLAEELKARKTSLIEPL